MTTALNSGLETRKRLIGQTEGYLKQTEQLFQAYGSVKLKNTLAHFDEMKDSLASGHEVKLVVIGEFSRGKSSLVNALMGVDLLSTAQEATTAINTFLKKLPEGQQQRFIRVHFQTNQQTKQPSQDIIWVEGDDDVLIKWSTELEQTNADLRKNIERIEVFLDHPLLNQGLILIDTPGLQSFMQHHEEITRRAIAESHIALWVQTTQQLGGNATEWSFLSHTIRRNFNKFLTVVNMWDNVLDPQDSADRKKPQAEREQEKMQRVRDNFEKHLSGMDKQQLAQMTNSEHLIGVSARWALHGSDEQKQRSNIQQLSRRIGQMLSSGEALEQVYKKPLKMLDDIQGRLIDSIEDEIDELQSSKSLTEREHESAMLDKDIKNLQLEIKQANTDADAEHQRGQTVLCKQIEQQLIAPLTLLKGQIDRDITVNYVRKQFDQARKQSGQNSFSLQLPPDIHQSFEDTMQKVQASMEKQNEQVAKVLTGLRADYADKMKKHTGVLNAGLSSMKVQLPALDVSFELDFSEMNEYEATRQRLLDKIAEQKRLLEQAENEARQHAGDPAKVQAAKDALDRVNRQMSNLGSRPAPTRHTERVAVERSGFFGWLADCVSTKYETRSYTDDSNGQNWDAERQRLARANESQEAALQRIQDEEFKKSGKRLTAERAAKKLQQELENDRKAIEKAEQASGSAREKLIQEAHQSLLLSTVGEIEKRINTLSGQVIPAIEDSFSMQLGLLKACVEEQFMQPLNAKLEQRQAVNALMKQDKASVELRKNFLQQGLQQLGALRRDTQNALTAKM